MKRLWLILAVVAMNFAGAMPAPQAEAFRIGASLPQRFPVDVFDAAHQVDEHRGYFKNNLDLFGTKVFPEGITANTEAAFIAKITNECRTGDTQHQVGAEFIILTMLGRPAGTPRGSVGNCAAANATYQAWVRAVQAYPASQVDYSVNVFYRCGELNTYYQDGQQDVAFFNANNNDGPECNMTREMIVFTNADGSQYRIKKNCANPVGDLAPLDQDFSVTLSADRNGGPLQVGVGDTASIHVRLRNNGPARTDPGALQIMYPGARVVQPCAPTCADGSQGAATAYGGPRGFAATSNIPGHAGVNWRWNINPVPRNGFLDAVLNFTISPTAAPGNLQFTVLFYPSNLAGGVATATVDISLVSVRTPGFVGLNGDIHAGDCTQSAISGYVQTSPGGPSYGQYVVSASGSTSGLYSNAATSAANDKLKIGKTGGYSRICRPNLLAAASRASSGPGYSTIGITGPTTVFNMTGNEEGVYFYSGQHLVVRGTVGNPVSAGPPAVARKPVTIVALSGDVRIDGNITLNNTVFPARSVPSLGIISAGSILINPNVNRVDAYLFSNETIYTCAGGGIPCTAAASAQLVVNGFLMAKDIEFGRLGAFNTSGRPVTELIILTPQIYLNPPKFFDASVDDLTLEGQGERPPLY